MVQRGTFECLESRVLGRTARPPAGIWSSRTLFVLALTGGAVGLGNIWRFPYLAGEHGGGAFLAVYVACVLLVGLPLMAAELLIGRRGRRNPVASLAALAAGEGRHPAWAGLAVLGVVAAVLLLAAYSVVGGWSMAYVVRSAGGTLEGLDAIDAQRVFRELTESPERMLAWHTVFLAVTVMVVSRGLRFGLEEAARWFVPLLLVLLLALVFLARNSPGFGQAVSFLARPDPAALGSAGALAALGHAFFSLTLGVGAVTAFGRYADERLPLLTISLVVVLLDTLVAVLAGVALFPHVFAAGLAPDAGPGLMFQTLPVALDSAVGGRYLGTLFFAMLCLAAWTSAITIMEPVVVFLQERLHVDRALAASVAGVVVWGLGLVTLLSFGPWSHLTVPIGIPGVAPVGLFEGAIHLAVNILLPLAGLGLSAFMGWRVSRMTLRLGLGGGTGFRAWLCLIRFVTPAAMLVVALHATGLLERLVLIAR